MQFVKLCAIFAISLWLTACGSIDLSQLGTLFPARHTYPVSTETSPGMGTTGQATDMLAYRVQVAKKIMQMNESMTFSGTVPDPLASIPVIEISLHSDGSIRGLSVSRTPRFHVETVQLAMAAIRRAAPFASVTHLPQPWVFNETFLFNDAFKFQLHSLQP